MRTNRWTDRQTKGLAIEVGKKLKKVTNTDKWMDEQKQRHVAFYLTLNSEQMIVLSLMSKLVHWVHFLFQFWRAITWEGFRISSNFLDSNKDISLLYELLFARDLGIWSIPQFPESNNKSKNPFLLSFVWNDWKSNSPASGVTCRLIIGLVGSGRFWWISRCS